MHLQAEFAQGTMESPDILFILSSGFYVEVKLKIMPGSGIVNIWTITYDLHYKILSQANLVRILRHAAK